ncbi:hypothetical protein RVR_7277 [Actinacidiphila reveromycinica]|uniref:Uncharacterized protein n=1 Tax=Actinacidiphila reveromycinica TaxID=659352 RepID=A0A7U3VR34_9ACTN|nr:hypothetical protein [Streptomyces sp. SN-593]BBB00280.1 hypothetical protein RVR_7277 [Streptomyces sp. SN-593]
MNRTATQHASIAAESVNGLNLRVLANLARSEGADLARIKDVYEIAASLKVLAQRLTLAADQMGRLVGEWQDEGRLRTASALDSGALVEDFGSAMDDAQKSALALYAAFHHATESLAPIGWQEPEAAEAENLEVPCPEA